MDQEIKVAFEMAYLPVAQLRQRLNGQDFIGVAVPIMDCVRNQTSGGKKIREAAKTMVYSFNDLLNPKLPHDQLENMVNILVKNGPMVRLIAQQNQAEYKQLQKNK